MLRFVINKHEKWVVENKFESILNNIEQRTTTIQIHDVNDHTLLMVFDVNLIFHKKYSSNKYAAPVVDIVEFRHFVGINSELFVDISLKCKYLLNTYKWYKWFDLEQMYNITKIL